MAVKGSTLVTLADVRNGKFGKGVGKMAEVLMKHNAMLQDAPYFEANMGSYHEEEIRATLPKVYYVKANQGTPASKSSSEMRSFTTAHFESRSQIDYRVAAKGGKQNISYNRWKQASGHIQAMALEHADLFLYGSPADDHRKVAGFADIYSTLDVTESETAKQVVDGGGTGTDNTSIWLICWGENTVFGIYPAGSKAGLERIDRSPGGNQIQIQALDELNNPSHFWGFEEDFHMDHGLVVKDYRQVSRFANIDVSNLNSTVIPYPGADIIRGMIKQTYLIDNLENGTPVFYCNRTIEAHLHLQALDKVSNGNQLNFETVAGKRVLHLLQIPIRRMDSILVTEEAVEA